MPYIKKDKRPELDVIIKLLHGRIGSSGDLNYVITSIARDFLIQKGECYQTYSDIISAFECAKLELYRRKVAKYENTKIDENGDVY